MATRRPSSSRDTRRGGRDSGIRDVDAGPRSDGDLTAPPPHHGYCNKVATAHAMLARLAPRLSRAPDTGRGMRAMTRQPADRQSVIESRRRDHGVTKITSVRLFLRAQLNGCGSPGATNGLRAKINAGNVS